MLLRRLAGFYMPGGDLSSFEARYSFFFNFCLGCVVHILDIFLSFSLLFARKCIFEGIFSRMPNFLFFSTALPLLVFLFRYPLQDLQKAATWGGMCGSRRQRMVRQLLYSRANSSVKKYVLHYKGFLKYWRSKGVIVTLPCDSLLYQNISRISRMPKIHTLFSPWPFFCFEVGARYHFPRSPR